MNNYILSTYNAGSYNMTAHITNKTLLKLTNEFPVVVHLISNRSQMTSKCGKNKKVEHKAQLRVSLTFSPHFVILCDLLPYSPTARGSLFVSDDSKAKCSSW